MALQGEALNSQSLEFLEEWVRGWPRPKHTSPVSGYLALPRRPMSCQ